MPRPPRRPSPGTRLLGTGWLLLSLLSFAGCAAQSVQTEVVRVQVCDIPTGRLEPTQEPQLRDATNGELLSEIDGEAGWRIALLACNRDKSDIRRLIDEANRKGGTTK